MSSKEIPSPKGLSKFGLKSSPHAEANARPLFTEKDAGQRAESSSPRVRIIEENQTKRHVDDRNLGAKLHTQRGTIICELGEARIAYTNKRIGLRLAAHEDGLK